MAIALYGFNHAKLASRARLLVLTFAFCWAFKSAQDIFSPRDSLHQAQRFRQAFD